jgi:hypothetical protein
VWLCGGVVLRSPEADFGTALRPHEIGWPVELADDMPGTP